MEIAGVVLGGIPVVLEAYDRYRVLSRAFSDFRNHESELKKLNATLNTQRALFRKSVADVLIALTGNPEKVNSVLDGNAAWDDLLSSESVFVVEFNNVKELFEAWKANLDPINGVIQSICAELETFLSSCPTNPVTVRAPLP